MDIIKKRKLLEEKNDIDEKKAKSEKQTAEAEKLLGASSRKKMDINRLRV